MTAPATITPQALRSALGRFATGVTIITCVDADGQRVGLTANSFNALSLDPPLVLWSLRVGSPVFEAFESATHFAVNVLAASQVELSRRFAAPVDDRFAEGQWSAGLGGGDHRLYIGEVLRLVEQDIAPLLFHGGHYRMLGEIL
jgi:flavin reductase (DIM6/NTAB) family NADH-FMN oxidoreductase RutF